MGPEISKPNLRLCFCEEVDKIITKNDFPLKTMNDRSSHDDQIERWANFVRDHPTEWKKIHTEFINAIFQKHDEFIERLLKEPNGKQKIIELYGIKNLDGYPSLKWLFFFHLVIKNNSCSSTLTLYIPFIQMCKVEIMPFPPSNKSDLNLYKKSP